MSAVTISRRDGESIWVNDELEIVVKLVDSRCRSGTRGRQVRLTFVGDPAKFRITRAELLAQANPTPSPGGQPQGESQGNPRIPRIPRT